ncbi:MAG: type 4a pilus biogenesis protein PilO [bacterium]
MRRNNNNYHLLLALIVVSACFYYSQSKLVPKYREDKANLSLIQLELNAINNKKVSLQNSQTSIDELGDIVNKMLIAVPQDKDAPNLVAELEAIAIKYQVQLPSIQILDSATGGADGMTTESDNVIPVAITVNGTYSDIQQFIGAVEKDIRFMNIRNLTLSSIGNTVSLNLQLNAYKRSDTALSDVLFQPTANSVNNTSVEVTE